MLYKYGEKIYNIDDKTINNYICSLNITEKEAIELYLSDSGIMPLSDEQKHLKIQKLIMD